MFVYGGFVWLGLKMMNYVLFFGVWNIDIYICKVLLKMVIYLKYMYIYK